MTKYLEVDGSSRRLSMLRAKALVASVDFVLDGRVRRGKGVCAGKM